MRASGVRSSCETEEMNSDCVFSGPMIYTNGEVIGVLRYVTTLRIVDRQVFLIAVVTIAVGLLLIAFMLFMSSFFIRSILEPVSQITATAKHRTGSPGCPPHTACSRA